MKRPKFTSRVRRGLASMRSLVIDALDDDKPPASTVVQGWKAGAQKDFNVAMAWLESLEAPAAENQGGEKGTEPDGAGAQAP